MFVSKWGPYGEVDERSYPKDVAVGPDGSVYVMWCMSGCNYSFNEIAQDKDRIQKFTSDGVAVSKWGADGEGDGELSDASGVAVAPDGSVYVLDSGNHRIQKFSTGP